MATGTSDKKNNNSKPPYFRRMVIRMWLLLFLGIVSSVLLFVFISFTNLPDTAELENPKFEYATKVFTSDNQELGRYFRKNRDWVFPEDLNPHLVNALVSTEDERFFNHSGIDYRGVARAVFFLGKRGGASTITQQLAKLLFHKRATSFIPRVFQKFKEWIIALRIEKRYTKEEIISMYLNKFDFLYDSDGVAAASQTYFAKNQEDLAVEEAAMLIGMLKNPYIYNPRRVPERARLRREVVLKQMLRNDVLTDEAYNEIRQRPLDMSNFRRQEDSEGLAPYFRAELTKWVKKILNEEEYYKPDGTRYNIYTDGLKIYTTIDSKMQRHAEAAVRKNMVQVQERYFKRWENKDPWTYRADKDQKRIRKASLNNLIQQTALYQSIQDQFMAEIFSEINANIEGASLRNIDILRMFSQQKNDDYFQRILEAKWATKDQIAGYTAVMNSPYWKELRSQWIKMENAVKKRFNTKKSMKVYDYKTGGLKTMRMTPLDSIKFHRQHMQSGMLAIEPSTGYVKSWVGGINHQMFQYDHVNSNRQVGSTFKPFVYAAAIFLQGISPCFKVEDVQYSIPAKDADFGLMKTWSPSNADGKFSKEKLTLYEGLKKSKNSVSVYLMKELGSVNEVRELAANMGVPIDKIPSAPSICLGTPELSLMDMTSAYSTFANNGIHNEPIFVSRIEDKDGQLIYTAVPEQYNALPKNYNYVMVDMLRNAASFISGKFTTEIGGKTGTTNDYVDGWFMGITPNLVVGTWVGGEDPWIRFLNLADGQGGVMARPTFVEFITRLENDPSVDFDETAKFAKPEDFDIQIDCSFYQRMEDQDEYDRIIDQSDDDDTDYFDDFDNQ